MLKVGHWVIIACKKPPQKSYILYIFGHDGNQTRGDAPVHINLILIKASLIKINNNNKIKMHQTVVSLLLLTGYKNGK